MREGTKRPLYYCKRLKSGDPGYQEDAAGEEQFAAPVLRYLNYRSLNAETELETIGEVDSKHLIAKQLSGGDTYTENDRCYIFVTPPTTPDPLCTNADFRVKSVLYHHRKVEIVFERTTVDANATS